MTFEQFKKSICDKDPQVKWALDLIDEEVKEALQQQKEEMAKEENIADLMLEELPVKKRRQFCSCYDEGIIEGAKEYRQFILNVLDGIDIADKELGGGGTKAIRLAIKSRII